MFLLERSKKSERKNLQFVSEHAKEFVEDLKQKDGKNILQMGGGDLAKTFFEENLIDKLILGIEPMILGKGTSAAVFAAREAERFGKN